MIRQGRGSAHDPPDHSLSLDCDSRPALPADAGYDENPLSDCPLGSVSWEAVLTTLPTIRYRLTAILATHWWDFVRTYGRWIRPVVFENVRKVLACRTAVLGCHVYACPSCDHVQLVPHSCKSRFCPTCGKHATDVWADGVLSQLLDVPYHHLVLSTPWQLRQLIAMNRNVGLNILVRSAVEAIQQWARDVKGMRMGIVAVIHTFGSDLKWHPHIHLIVTGGGLSLDGRRWIATDPRFLMHHSGLKKRWKYQVITRLRASHKLGELRFPGAASYLGAYPKFARWIKRLWPFTWYAHIGTSLLDPRFSIRYVGRYTKRAVLAEYRIRHYDGKYVTISFKDYAQGGKTSYKTMKVMTFIARLIHHIPNKNFPMIRHAGLFAGRWKKRHLAQARAALGRKPEPPTIPKPPSWEERQQSLNGASPLICPHCDVPLVSVGMAFGPWLEVEEVFIRANSPRRIPSALLKPG